MNLDTPVIGILRGVDSAFFKGVMDTSFASGLQAIEITINTDGAEKIVSTNISNVPSGKLLGMGTIRNIDEAKRAVDSGAMFLVSPNTNIEVIEFSKASSVPIIAGALTPTEVYNAWTSGADMIKVFPCRPFGPDYIKELRGPFEQVPLVAVGGIDLNNIADYFTAGARAVGASTSLFGKQALMDRDLDGIARNVANFISLCP